MTKAGISVTIRQYMMPEWVHTGCCQAEANERILLNFTGRFRIHQDQGACHHWVEVKLNMSEPHLPGQRYWRLQRHAIYLLQQIVQYLVDCFEILLFVISDFVGRIDLQKRYRAQAMKSWYFSEPKITERIYLKWLDSIFSIKQVRYHLQHVYVMTSRSLCQKHELHSHSCACFCGCFFFILEY